MFYLSYAGSHVLSDEQEKAAFSISACKTGKLGYNISRCPECGHLEIHACSCNNRHCPCCQYPLEQKWVAQRASEIIPDTAYYHVVFTIPSELYGLMFRASSDTLVKLCTDPKWLGAKPGIISVLHTAGQKLNYHPHIHAIITGGGLTPSGFHRVRFSGFLSNSVKAKSLTLIHKLLGSVYAGDPVKGKTMRELILYLFNRDICECPDCKGTMLRLARGVPLAFAN